MSMPLNRDNVGTPIPQAWITLSIVSLQGLQTHSGCVAVLVELGVVLRL